MGQQMSDPHISNGVNIPHESESWGFKSLSGRDIFYLKDLDTFTRTSVRVSKMNAVAHAQLTFQMQTFLKKYLYHKSQCSKTWGSKCLVLICQMVRVIGMNPKVGDSSPSQAETFSVSNFFALSPENPFLCGKRMLLSTQS